MLQRLREWASPLKPQDVVAMSFLAGVVDLLVLMKFNRRLGNRLQRPARSLVIFVAFIALLVLTLIALKWG